MLKFIDNLKTKDLLHVQNVQESKANKFYDVWILDTNTEEANSQQLNDYSEEGEQLICCLDTDNKVSDAFNGLVRVIEFYSERGTNKFSSIYEGNVVNANINGFGRHINVNRDVATMYFLANEVDPQFTISQTDAGTGLRFEAGVATYSGFYAKEQDVNTEPQTPSKFTKFTQVQP